MAGDRGLYFARTAHLGGVVDLAADGHELRCPVQAQDLAQDPAHVGRVDAGDALRAGLPGQGAQRSSDDCRTWDVEPAREPVGFVRAGQ